MNVSFKEEKRTERKLIKGSSTSKNGGCPVLEVLKARQDGALGSLFYYQIWRLVILPVAGVMEPDDPWGLFQPKLFYDSMT